MDTDRAEPCTTAIYSLRYGDVTSAVLRAFLDVYDELGAGFVESVYAGAMEVALAEVGLDARRELPLAVAFRGHRVGVFRPDLDVNGSVILELKVARALHEDHDAQLLNHLKATGIDIGLLLSFGSAAKFRRLILDARPGRIRADP